RSGRVPNRWWACRYIACRTLRNGIGVKRLTSWRLVPQHLACQRLKLKLPKECVERERLVRAGHVVKLLQSRFESCKCSEVNTRMANKNRLPPIHPGEILREEFLSPLGMSAHELALALRVRGEAAGSS